MSYTPLNLTNWAMEKIRSAQLAEPPQPPEQTLLFKIVRYALAWILVLKEVNQLQPVLLTQYAPWLSMWTDGMATQLIQLLGAFSSQDTGYTSAAFQYSDEDTVPWILEMKEQLYKAEQPLARWRANCSAGEGIQWDKAVQALQYTYIELYDRMPYMQLFTNIAAFYVAVDSAARQYMHLPLRVEQVRAGTSGRLRLSPSSGSSGVSSNITLSQIEARAVGLRARGLSMTHNDGEWEMMNTDDE